MEFSAQACQRFEETMAQYPVKKAALLPCLWIAQEEQGTLTREALEHVAQLLEIPVSHVFGVVSFYSMYQTQPIGKHHIQLCRTLSCELNGAEGILEHFCQQLKIRPGQTTEDGLITLTTVECLASCDTGPMCQINNDYHENLTPDTIDELLAQLRENP